MLEELKHIVWQANLELVRRGLVLYTWGNASAIDRAGGLVVIKPSGVPYDSMTPEDMVVVDLKGNAVEGKYRPSSDTPTHLVLYQAFPNIGGVVHTHSTYATSWAQAGLDIPNLGTTHSDYFRLDIPCTRDMRKSEVFGEYEKETGNVIVERFKGIDPDDTPAALVKNHGPFTWGADADSAVHNAVVLEEVAKMAYISLVVNMASAQGFDPGHLRVKKWLVEKHYSRKHGPAAYYGQPCHSERSEESRSEESDN
ncbi:MAG: L-ribulose-5-phosphate 4-epimerase [Bacteroidales bacterium]|nr:L-ribulose-5-phosphate 4-epimerase [Bacteroidales bacterium]